MTQLLCRPSQIDSTHPGRRRGFTLIEMLAVMTMSTMVLGLLFLMLVGIIRRMNTADLQLARQWNLSHAAQTIRDLAHESSGFEISDHGNSLILKPSGASKSPIHIKIADHPFRLEITNASSSKGRVLGLTGLERGRFSTIAIKEASAAMIVLEFWPDSAATKRLNMPVASENRPIRIEAAIGIDLLKNSSISSEAIK